MKIKFSATVLLAFASFLVTSESAKILGLFTSFGRSHLIVHMSVIRELVNRGHNVTVVTIQDLDDPHPGYRHIRLNISDTSKEFVAENFKIRKSFVAGLTRISNFVMEQANASLSEPQMKTLMAEESFDLVILGYFFNDFQAGVAAHFKCPYVMIFSIGIPGSLNGIVGNPIEPLYVPHKFQSAKQPLGFLDRLKNFVMTIADIVVFWSIDLKMETYYKYNFPSERYPSYHSVRKNISLILTNHHFSNGPIRPDVPGVIEIGGIQIKPKADPLPDDLRKFLDGASTDGAIFFSLGSNARSVDMKSDTLTIVYDVLSKLKQRVIWKWEDDAPPGNASNILFRKWLPQDDILAHPNIKLFITHGGHGSVVESEYHGVPMVGMPLFADQFANMDAVQSAGYGISLGQKEITGELFRDTVKEVLENPTYRDKVQTFSKLYRDRPMSARDTAAFWIEYVIRHRGAKHMQSPAVHMNTIEYYGLDIAAFLLCTLYIIYRVLKLIFRFIFSLIFGKKCIKKGKDEKDKLKKLQ